MTRHGLGVVVLTLGLVGMLSLRPVRAADEDKENPIVASVKSKLKSPDKPFTLLIHLSVKEDRGDKFELAFATARRETRKEKGNLAYDLCRDTENPSRYLIYERWKNVAALEEHLKTSYIKRLLSELPDLTMGAPESHVLTPVAE